MRPTPCGGRTKSEEEQGETPPQEAERQSRQAYWPSLGGFQETPVFDFDQLRPGNRIEGPALIEARETTYVLEPGWSFVKALGLAADELKRVKDGFGSGVLRLVAA